MREFKYRADIGVTRIFSEYKKGTKNPCNLKDSQYSSVLRDINKGILEKMVQENFYFDVPYDLGTFCIVRYKWKPKIVNGKLDRKGLATNYQASWKLWEQLYGKPHDKLKDNLKYWGSIEDKPRVYHENDHTSGYRYKFYWIKNRSKVKNQYYYAIKFVRDCRDYLVNSINTNPFLYFNEINK